MRPGESFRAVITAFVIGVSVLAPGGVFASVGQVATVKPAIDDTWQGTLHAQKDSRIVVKVSKAVDGTLKAQMFSIDESSAAIPVKTVTFREGFFQLSVDAIGGAYSGTLSPDGAAISGEWKQGDSSLPLVLMRATSATAWALPEPPKHNEPMAADADPSWEVATIRLSPPSSEPYSFTGGLRNFQMLRTTVRDLLQFAYGLNARQIVGLPTWAETDKFDIITGQPNVPGDPSIEQLKLMLRKLLVERFDLASHHGTKEMSAYVLSQSREGEKLTPSPAGAPNVPSFQTPKLGTTVFRNSTMDDFCQGLQFVVFDLPVVNRTGLTGRWDGTLRFTPDETQYQTLGVKIVPNEAVDAPPPVFKAIQQQLGLKLEAQKTAVDVLVIEHVNKPNDN